MQAVPVDDYRSALVIQVVDASADEFIALWLEIGDDRRNIRVTGKPRLHGVLVRGHDVNKMRRHQRTHVRTHEFVDHRVRKWGC